MTDSEARDLARYPLIHASERREFQAFRWGLCTGLLMGAGAALLVFVVAVGVFA